MQTSTGGKTLFRSSLIVLSVLFTTAALVAPARPAFALSELKNEQGQVQQKPAEGSETPPVEEEQEETDPLELPMPDPLIRRNEAVTEPSDGTPAADDKAADEPEVPVEFLSDIAKAPEPVRRMRELIVEAAASGDIERLRPLLGKGMTETQVSIVETDEGPVETLKGQSGDDEGIEVLAILLDVLATGFVHVGKGTADELYVWPYFAEKPLATLTPPEKVDLLRIVTAGDFADMKEFGSYNFYRVGITPDGQWKFFVTGD
ncbi:MULTISPECIES: hypothetical protein [unclassified Shinella]|uniref:hypothetical protein n=1 Tax=unclassified Shinella TaxID=2643062 RepID=UPI00225D1C2B|nr:MULTISPECIES: hypothetical protein [unclassified Shinella]MCO5136121.1 hypothetical protein [Shinella sp.]MDC7254242.1 hypothetical protein [Shinella sp. YE25]CAI0336920.1 conserved hypothetical protein [Rhizobiaceae bacterium]CAK7255447.1 conserved protein of unknown function [Shinella sp. WSC3-e]